MSGSSLLRQLEHQLQPDLPDEAGDLQGMAGELADNISLESMEVQRLCDIAAGLEDLIHAMESVSEPTPAHLMLLEAGINMSFAGTPMRPADLRPALESRDNLNVSLEGVKERVEQIVQQIKRFLTFLWNKIRDFVQAAVGEVARAKHRLDFLVGRCNEIDGRAPVHAQIRLGQNVYGMATDRGVPPDAYVWNRNLHNLQQVMQGIRTHYVPTVIKIGHALQGSLRHYRPDTAEQWLVSLNHIATAYDVHSFAAHVGQTTSVVDSRYTAGTAVSSLPLPGNRSLVFLDGKKVYPDRVNGSAADQAVMYQASTVDLIRMQVTKTIEPSKAVMRTLTPDEIQSVLAQAGQVLAEVEAGVNSRLQLELSQSAKDLMTAADSIGHQTESQSLEYFRRGMAYCTAYSVWAPRPYVQLLAHSLSVVRATLGACSRHLQAYDSVETE